MDVTPASPPQMQTGPYYALLIGNKRYKYLPELETPINDARAIGELLYERYGFHTKVLRDADRAQILTALVEYRRKLPEKSNLLIYYAGHGAHDPDADEAYWLPIDAQRDNNANWISADDITRNVRAIPSAHVLIISDSCYSGYLTTSRTAGARITPKQRSVLLAQLLGSKSRTLMSSGRDEPVMDTGAPGHSVFAAAILDGLREIEDDSFSAEELFEGFVKPEVGGGSNQLPLYREILNSGHKYGDFIFSREPVGDEHTGTSAPGARATGATKANAAATDGAPAPEAGKEAVKETAAELAPSRTSSAPARFVVWAVGWSNLILHTDDEGQSWKSQGSGVNLGFLLDLESITFATPQSGWAVGRSLSSAVLHTEDGGVSWKNQEITEKALYSVAFTTSQSGWVVGGDGTILHTNDGGRTWNRQRSGIKDGLTFVAFATPESGWAVSDGGSILHTEDGGNHWKQQFRLSATSMYDPTKDLIKPEGVIALWSVAARTPLSVWVVGYNGAILHTEDKGASWALQNSGTKLSLNSVAFATVQSGWVVGDMGAILHTEDGGRSWKPQKSGSQQDLRSVVFATPQEGWVVGDGGTILHTDDGGLSWKPQTGDSQIKYFRSLALAMPR